MSSPAGSFFHDPGDGLRLQVANCASRSAPSPTAAWEQGRRRQILGQGRLLALAKAELMDLIGDRLTALVRDQGYSGQSLHSN